MSEDRYQGWLDDYVDGILPDPARGELESHLAGCDGCRALASDLARIKDEASRLERPEPPERVWQRITERLPAAPAGPSGTRLTGARWGSTRIGWLHLAAAAVVLLVLALVIERSRTRPPELSPAASREELASFVAAELRLAEQHYENAIGGLEKIVAEDRSALDPELVAVLEQNLDLLDRAIGESRTALEEQPGSEVARESLLEALRRKLALLQNTILLINEIRQGRGENARDLVDKISEGRS